ncbi:unnamed protein product [[Candida] boidinii]|nr:unnamed protein product [[Candida] boidinii]
MHSFVDQMEFAEMSFLDALREFLQSFRLPGESQKIDRFMLKFAERYVNGNPTIFANADTVYVLAYSVIMLNTDQHSPQVKNKMTLDDFINNNRGIDDGKDLPYEFLSEIYSDIQNDEIILKSEQHAALITNEQPEISTGFFGGRDAVKEAYLKASKELSNKTEQVVKSLRDKSKGSKNELIFYSATNHTEHVRSIFDTLWMSILAGLTPPFKDYDDLKITKTLLEGIYLSIRISCLFDIAYARTSFIRALVQFANLNNLEELKEKNVVAIQTILDVAVTQNSLLKSSWKLVLTSISQIERLHLIAQGVSSDTVPDLLNAMLANRNSIDTIRAQQATTNGFFSFGKKQTISEQNFMHHLNQKLPAEIITKITTSGLDVAIDKVFSKSSEIEGDGIFDFIAALTEVAYEEIESSGQSEHPRMFSLQKMVDVCYYNMGRIRVQWSALWTVMGEKFNEFGCHSNTHIAFFAIDSLRQLSERFFDIEELSHFKFQKEFLKPFSYILVNNDNMAVKEMVLDCVQYMVQKKNTNIKSGWVSILDILTNAAKENNEKLVSKAYSYASLINKKEFQTIYKQDAYEPLVLCLTEFAKNEVFQKTSLQALQDMKKIVHYIAEINANNETENTLIQYWFPILFGFHDVIMTDL